jgi:hypothetical protein
MFVTCPEDNAHSSFDGRLSATEMGLIWGFCPLLSAFKVEVAGIVKQRKITGNNGRTDFRFQFPQGSGGSSPFIRTNLAGISKNAKGGVASLGFTCL